MKTCICQLLENLTPHSYKLTQITKRQKKVYDTIVYEQIEDYVKNGIKAFWFNSDFTSWIEFLNICKKYDYAFYSTEKLGLFEVVKRNCLLSELYT